MPVTDSLVSRFQGGDNYGFLEKGFWSRDARKKNAAESYAAAAAAQEVGDQVSRSNEAQITKERDERLHGQDMSRMNESYAKQLANRLAEMYASGALAQGDMVKNQAELDAIGHPERLKIQPEIVRNQLGAKLGQTTAERIRAQKFAEKTGELTDAELAAQMATLQKGKTVAEYDTANVGTRDQLAAAKLLLDKDMAEKIAGVRSATDIREAEIRAGKGGGTKVPITAVESKPGSGKIDLNKLKGMSGSQPAPAGATPGNFSPETMQALEEVMPFLIQLFKGGAAAPK